MALKSAASAACRRWGASATRDGQIDEGHIKPILSVVGTSRLSAWLTTEQAQTECLAALLARRATSHTRSGPPPLADDCDDADDRRTEPRSGRGQSWQDCHK